jgi:hypothetical protein
MHLNDSPSVSLKKKKLSFLLVSEFAPRKIDEHDATHKIRWLKITENYCSTKPRSIIGCPRTARCEEEQQISSPPPILMNLPLPLVKNNKKRNPDIMI